MPDYIAEFTVKPASHATEFMQLIAGISQGLKADANLSIEGVAVSVVQQPSGQVQAILTYRSHEMDRQWHTTALVTRTDNCAWVRVEMLPVNQVSSLYRPGKPAIIDVLLDSLGSTGDLPFVAQKSAIDVSNRYVAHVERLVAGTSSAELPVLYATAEFLNSKALNESELVNRLYGLALVFIESDKHVSKKLKKRLTSNGTTPPLWPACLIWPGNEVSAPAMSCVRQWEELKGALSGNTLLATLEDLLQDAVSHRQPCNRARWTEASQILFTDTGKELAPPTPAKASVLADLGAESADQNKTADMRRTTLLDLKSSSEQDMVEGETLEMVLDAIEHYLQYKLQSDPDKEAESCRRADVLKAVLSANTLSTRTLEQYKSRLKKILDGTRGINRETESALRKIGIHVTHGGKHPKLTLGQDTRYVLTAPSSSSDNQAWHNVLRDIERKFF